MGLVLTNDLEKIIHSSLEKQKLLDECILKEGLFINYTIRSW